MKLIKYDADNPVNFKNLLNLIYPVNPSILKTLILTIFILFSTNTLHALTPVIIDENTESVSLGKYMEILEDPTGELTIDDVTKPVMQGRWFQSKWDVPNFGFTNSSYWFRVSINNHGIINEYILELSWHLIDLFELYYKDKSNSFTQIVSGNIVKNKSESKKNKYYTYKIPFHTENQIIYIKLKSDYTIQLPLELLSLNYHDISERRDSYILGGFIGILIVMIFYNFFIFISIKDISYLLYILYITSQLIYNLLYTGIGGELFGMSDPIFYKIVFPLSLIFVTITALLFVSNFLNMKKNKGKIYFSFFVIIYISILNIVLPLIGLGLYCVIIQNALISIGTILIIISSGYLSITNRPARIFLISWTVLLSGAIIVILKNYGIIPYNDFTNNYVYLATIIETVLLSFALADRINIMKQEKEEAQSEALRIQKEATETLELKVTERTTELADANEKLRELDKAKTDFFANISHELRTPLTLILAPVEEALSGRELNKNILEMVRRNALDLLSLINGLLEMSRITAGKHKLNIAETDLSELVKQFCGGMESAAKLKEIELRCRAEKPVTIYADRDRLSNIISNFFSNSFKFTEPGGKIEVAVKSENNHAIIEFRDTGCGITGDKLGTIFERFTQADTGSTRKYEGTGIGLSIVKELVELHGGEVSVESRCAEEDAENHGTLFTVKFPFGKEHFEERDDVEFISTGEKIPVIIPHVRGVELPRGTEERLLDALSETAPAILVVEDNSDLRSLLVNMLSVSYIVHEASNGIEAVKILESTDEIDLVLSDIMMPGMDGHELLKWIRGNERLEGLPVLLLTARADLFMRIEGLDLGATDYVTKPFNSDELLLRIKNQMELKLLRNKTERNYRKLLEKLETVKTRPLGEESAAKIKAVCEFIKENFSCDLTREDLAAASGMNPDTFSRAFNQHTGKTLNDYICDLRIEEAKRRLRETGETVTRIAIDTGFDNIRTFNRVFKRLAGVAPGEFREGLRN